jgi:hypothetical protein
MKIALFRGVHPDALLTSNAYAAAQESLTENRHKRTQEK